MFEKSSSESIGEVLPFTSFPLGCADLDVYVGWLSELGCVFAVCLQAALLWGIACHEVVAFYLS